MYSHNFRFIYITINDFFSYFKNKFVNVIMAPQLRNKKKNNDPVETGNHEANTANKKQKSVTIQAAKF